MSLENLQTPDSALIIATEEAKATPESLSETSPTADPVAETKNDADISIPSDQAFTETELFQKLYYELGVGGI